MTPRISILSPTQAAITSSRRTLFGRREIETYALRIAGVWVWEFNGRPVDWHLARRLEAERELERIAAMWARRERREGERPN